MSNTQSVLDRFAIGASTLCALHCVVTPVLITLFPSLLVTILGDHWFHLLLIVVVVPISLFALFLGCKKHRDRLVLTLGGVGLLALTFIAIFGHDLLGEAGEKVGTVLSSLLIVAAHVRNHWLCRKGNC